jgi:hypothetical protein
MKARGDLVAVFDRCTMSPASQRRELTQALPASRARWAAGLYWRFYEYERFRERIVPWPADLQERVERHDYLLDWRRGERALRYCHYVDDAEHAELVAAAGLAEVEIYRADGFTGEVNRYSILQKSA